MKNKIYLKLSETHLKIGKIPKGNDRILYSYYIIFQVQTVSFSEGMES